MGTVMNFDTVGLSRAILFLVFTNFPWWRFTKAAWQTMMVHGSSPPLSLPPPSRPSPRLHNEGRMLDIFQRLSATEGSFFVPRDLEVSNQELDYIIQKAEQWRGFNGERRKVSQLARLTSLNPDPNQTGLARIFSFHVFLFSMVPLTMVVA